ncbi:hypothetical protein [Neorhodopirellula lusitana]|nr:hypothetical protein [Neorhodopirellula lusitana]
MSASKLVSRIPGFPPFSLCSLASVCSLFIAVSLLAGWFIPEFYAWTDSDQSRPSPLLWKVPLGAAVASTAFCMVLPWLPMQTNPIRDTPSPSMRFSLRALMMLTAGIAVAIPLLAKYPLVVSGIICAGAYGCLIAFSVRNPPHRMASFALFGSMILPYAWVIGYEELDRILPTLTVIIAGMPTFLPAALLGSTFGQHFQESQWLSFLLTALEIAVGVWIIRLGPKQTIAYLLLVLQISALGSLGFYMMCIA